MEEFESLIVIKNGNVHAVANGGRIKIMEKPRKFNVIYKGKDNEIKEASTDFEHTALNYKIKYNGTIYIDTRYEARKRLYFYFLRKNAAENF